jgi:hypothetical protein
VAARSIPRTIEFGIAARRTGRLEEFLGAFPFFAPRAKKGNRAIRSNKNAGPGKLEFGAKPQTPKIKTL